MRNMMSINPCVTKDDVIDNSESKRVGTWPWSVFNRDKTRRCLRPCVLKGDPSINDRVTADKGRLSDQMSKNMRTTGEGKLVSNFVMVISGYDPSGSLTQRLQPRHRIQGKEAQS